MPTTAARLWQYLRRHRLRYAIGIACLVGATTLTSACRLFKRIVGAIRLDQPFGGYIALIVAIALVTEH